MIKINRVLKSAIKYFQTCFTEKPNTEKENNMFFVFQNVDNSVRRLSNSTLIDNKGSNFDMNLKNNLEDKVKELERNKLLCCDMNETLIDSITDLYVKIINHNPEMKQFLQEQKETERIISKLITLSNISNTKATYNKAFFNRFKKSYLSN